MIGIIIAFIIGLIFTMWLAWRQASYKPMFDTERSANPVVWWIIGGAAVLGFAMLATVGITLLWDQGDAATITETPSPRAQARLLIPLLSVNEKIVNVPIKNGEWDISRLSGNIGWLELTGSRPDSDLPMVFIGHVTVSSLQKGPFANLSTIKPLTEIIYRDGGVDFVFKVDTLTPVKPTDTAKLFQRKKDHILLVTCTDYNLLTEKYDGRLIVDAVLVQRKIAPTQTGN